MFWSMENKNREKKMKGKINVRMTGSVKRGFGPRMWLSESPMSSSGPQQTAEREVDGKEKQEVVAGWLSDTCLWLTNLLLVPSSLLSLGRMSQEKAMGFPVNDMCYAYRGKEGGRGHIRTQLWCRQDTAVLEILPLHTLFTSLSDGYGCMCVSV